MTQRRDCRLQIERRDCRATPDGFARNDEGESPSVLKFDSLAMTLCSSEIANSNFLRAALVAFASLAMTSVNRSCLRR